MQLSSVKRKLQKTRVSFLYNQHGSPTFRNPNVWCRPLQPVLPVSCSLQVSRTRKKQSLQMMLKVLLKVPCWILAFLLRKVTLLLMMLPCPVGRGRQWIQFQDCLASSASNSRYSIIDLRAMHSPDYIVLQSPASQPPHLNFVKVSNTGTRLLSSSQLEVASSVQDGVVKRGRGRPGTIQSPRLFPRREKSFLNTVYFFPLS
jgi:hypothetical protein